MLEVVIASSNPGKIAEIQQIMHDLPVNLLTGEEVGGLPAVEETGATYLENARLKAEAVHRATGKAALADDSGLEVDALDGAPGVRSARLAGPSATDEQNNVRLISLLFGVPLERRTARYQCVAVLLRPDESEIVGSGACEGMIIEEPRGAGGFGYDPWFIPAGESRTMAELSPEEKHVISHRGKAFREVAAKLRVVLGGMDD
jgi:XTP/dITP diphosphohydrolase